LDLSKFAPLLWYCTVANPEHHPVLLFISGEAGFFAAARRMPEPYFFFPARIAGNKKGNLTPFEVNPY
jgi:hypothetical protein